MLLVLLWFGVLLLLLDEIEVTAVTGVVEEEEDDKEDDDVDGRADGGTELGEVILTGRGLSNEEARLEFGELKHDVGSLLI